MKIFKDNKFNEYKSVDYIVSIIGFIFIIIMVVNRDYYYKDIRENGIKSVGTIHVTGLHLTISHTVDGVTYTSLKNHIPYAGVKTGEQFEITYGNEDKSDCIINYDKPIYDKKSFNQTKALLIDFDKDTFQYQVDGETYTRIQDMDKNNYTKKDNYVVKYKKDNPAIAYLVYIPL